MLCPNPANHIVTWSATSPGIMGVRKMNVRTVLASSCCARWACGIAAAFASLLSTVALAGDECDVWHNLDTGFPGSFTVVQAATVYDGELIVGGSFTHSADFSQFFNRIARWDGTAWAPFSGGSIGVSNTVFSLGVFDDELIVGGEFTSAGGQAANRIARWDGAAWHPFLDDGVNGVNGRVLCMTEYQGDLVIGGIFTTAGDKTMNRIARWDGSEWQPFVMDDVVGVNGGVNAMIEHKGDLIVAGAFATAGPLIVNRIVRWDGTEWQPFIDFNDVIGSNGTSVLQLVEFENDIVAAGGFLDQEGEFTGMPARWSGGNWQSFGGGFNLVPKDLLVYNGDLIAAGQFTTSVDGGQTFNGIARWNSDEAAWEPFEVDGQIGMSAAVGSANIEALADYDGQLIAAGGFATAGGVIANHVARWRDCADAIVGDLDSNGVIDEQDRAMLCSALGSSDGEPEYISAADLNDDGVIDQLDQAMFNDILPPCAGDAVSSDTFAPPADGVTDGADLAYLLGAWGNAPSCADFVTSKSFAPPPDGKVDGADLAYLLGAWGGCGQAR